MKISYDQHMYSLYKKVIKTFPIWDHFVGNNNSLYFEFHTQHTINISYDKEIKKYTLTVYFKHNSQWLEFKEEYNCYREKEVLAFIKIYVKPVNDWAKLEMIKERKIYNKKISYLYKIRKNVVGTKRKREYEEELTDLRRITTFLKKEINKIK